jgi:hypothetical protein
MKILNYCFTLLIITVLFTACATSKQSRLMKDTINGNWILQTVNTEGTSVQFTAKVFNEADLNCFIGSNWSFNANNSLGSYTLTSSTPGCIALQRSIRWTLVEASDGSLKFQFKRLDDNRKPMDDNNGYRCSLTMADNNTMQMKSAFMLEGKAGNIIYNFIKKQ